MAKKGSSINQNFEALKAQMQAKRKLAENKFDKNDEEQNLKVSHDEEYITLNIVDDEEFDQIENDNAKENNENNDINIEDSEIKNEEIFNSEMQDDTNNINIVARSSRNKEVSNVNVNKIIIKRVEKQEAPKRITYYLKPETIKKIDKFSKACGMGKSEFVQTLLEEVLNNLEIEK